MGVMIGLWYGHIILASWAVGPMVLLGRRRAQWEYWEGLIFVLPFWTWGLLMLSPFEQGKKSLSNLGEVAYICIAVTVATAVRLVYGKRRHSRLLAAFLIAAAVVAAACTFFLTPLLPEP